MTVFDIFWLKNGRFWIFSQILLLMHVRRYLWEHFRKFPVKRNDKIWCYFPKPSKLGFWAKIAIFDIFGQEMIVFKIFPQIPLLTHVRRYLWDHFRKFPAKRNDKIWVISQKLSKTWILGKNDRFCLFWPKHCRVWIHK